MTQPFITWQCSSCGYKYPSDVEVSQVHHECPVTGCLEEFKKIVPAVGANPSLASAAGTPTATSPSADLHDPGAPGSSPAGPGSSDGGT